MTIIVAPLEQVQAILSAERPSHLISFRSPQHPIATFAHEPVHRLDLAFNDISAPRDDLVAPTDNDISLLLSFADGWRVWAPLVIHCWAGVSRSTAAAYIIACARSGPGHEEESAKALRAAAPFATPNPLMVALADERLGRGGAMSRAIAAIGRGAETGLGQAFRMEGFNSPDVGIAP